MAEQQSSSIALIGFMGSGKSTVGSILAARLRWEFVDADKAIVDRTRMSIPEIFATRGEAGFRAVESQCLADLASVGSTVVATGGGAPMEPRNRSFFDSRKTFFLHVSYEEFRRRTGRDRNRPLLQEGKKELLERFAERQEVYARIGVRLDTDGRRPEDVASAILTMLRHPRAADAP